MSSIDYMKVIDIIAATLNVDGDINVDATHDKIDIFEVKMTGYDKTEKRCRIYSHKYHLEILFPKIEFISVSFSRWLSKFEYELEQTFFKNIKISSREDAANHIIEVSF